MMATAFLGYVLPWGQMSLWGATVITNLFSVIPYAGDSIVMWGWGGFSVETPTLNRFFSLHYLLPFLIAGFVIVHLSLLHKDGSSNPTGITQKVDVISFYPYFSTKDTFSIMIFFIFFGLIITFYSNVLGHSDNYLEANSGCTPHHIVPEWYFLPFYAILRSMPTKIIGVLAMLGAILVLMILPWIHKAFYQSAKTRPVYFFSFWLFFFDFILLGWVGQKPVELPYTSLNSMLTFFYFLFFLILLPYMNKIEQVLVKIRFLVLPETKI
jgi:ubiquinol-cytochrome c reductase cytochrome b subunit